MISDEGHKVYFSGEQDKHDYVVGFLMYEDTASAALGCRPVSSRLVSIRLGAAPFNITIIQAYVTISVSPHVCFI